MITTSRSLLLVALLLPLTLLAPKAGADEVMATFDGWHGYMGNQPADTVWATLIVPPTGVSDWVGLEQAPDDSGPAFIQAGAYDGQCFTTSAVEGYIAQRTEGANLADCSIGDSVSVVLYTSWGPGATAYFSDSTTGDSWGVSDIPQGMGQNYAAEWVVEENPTDGAPPAVFPNLSFSNCGASVDGYPFVGGRGVTLVGLYDYGLGSLDFGIPHTLATDPDLNALQYPGASGFRVVQSTITRV